MARDDSLLYTGMSATSRQVQADKKEKQEAKADTRNELVPAADFVLEEIQKEKDALGEKLLGIVDPQDLDDQVQSKLNAVRMHREWLLAFEVRLKNVLRKPKETTNE